MPQLVIAARWLPTALPPAHLFAMQLRKRKAGAATAPGEKASSTHAASVPIRRRGLSSGASGGAGAAVASQQAQAARSAASPAAGSAPDTATSQDVPVVPTPEATNGEGSSAAKRKRGRLPPVDIGAAPECRSWGGPKTAMACWRLQLSAHALVSGPSPPAAVLMQASQRCFWGRGQRWRTWRRQQMPWTRCRWAGPASPSRVWRRRVTTC